MSAVANVMEGPARRPSELLPVSRTIPEASLRKHYWLDQVFRHATRVFAFLVLALLVGILISLVIGSLPSMKAFGLGFLVSAEWNPVTERFGALAKGERVGRGKPRL